MSARVFGTTVIRCSRASPSPSWHSASSAPDRPLATAPDAAAAAPTAAAPAAAAPAAAASAFTSKNAHEERTAYVNAGPPTLKTRMTAARGTIASMAAEDATREATDAPSSGGVENAISRRSCRRCSW